jgi:hypothetical protein
VVARKTGTYTTQANTVCPSSPDKTKPLEAGCLYATQNGFTNGSNNQTVSMAAGTSSLGSVSPSYWVTATVSENIPTLFSRVLGQSAMTVRSSAIAGVYSNTGNCVYLLDPTASKAFEDTGGTATLGCGIVVDSNASNAFNTTAHDALTLNNGASISVHGQWSDSTSGGCCTFNGGGSVLQNQASVANPVSGLTAPTPAATCTADPMVSGAHAALTPGTYCSISISNTGGGSNALTLNPGVYIMKTGDFHQSGGIVNALGVTLYFPTTGGAINVTAGTFNLTAPTGTSTDGIAIWEAGTSSGAITGGGSSITGLIYMPSAHLDYTGGSSGAETIVVDTLKITGGSIAGAASSSFLSNGSTASGIYLLPN